MKKKTAQLLTWGGGAALLLAGTLFGVNIYTGIQAAAENRAQPTTVASVYEENGYAQAPTKPTPTPEPIVESPVAESPAEEPVYEEPAPDYGIPIPWIADPNNAEGGYWDTTQCASSAGYTAPDGNQYCAP